MTIRFKLKIHSIIDIITNSSTELFVIDDDKSIEAVIEILNILCDKWNELAAIGCYGECNVLNKRKTLSNKTDKKPPQIKSFDDMFNKPYIYTKSQYEEQQRKDIIYKQEFNSSYSSLWDYESKENIGKIIISSAYDNSIPYQMFEWIEEIFNTTRHHLG